MDGFDIIGDIHGAARQLEDLLDMLGYRQASGVYSHPDRKIIFLGDFIDRGPEQKKVIDIVRPMIESGTALSVMGNHEFNAIAYATPDLKNPGEFLRRHNQRNNHQHQQFLQAYASDTEAYEDVIAWFKTLPLYLELDGIRVVHACWYVDKIDQLQGLLNKDNTLNEELILLATTKGTAEYKAVEILLKGLEISLPKDVVFHDKDGVERLNIRTRWWLNDATSYQKIAMLSSDIARTLPDTATPAGILPSYAKTEKPVFIGHYWLQGEPTCLATNVCCVDYSVGKPGGKLCCYRWDGEQVLRDDKLVWVERP